jgi:hypothetical protein
MWLGGPELVVTRATQPDGDGFLCASNVSLKSNFPIYDQLDMLK